MTKRLRMYDDEDAAKDAWATIIKQENNTNDAICITNPSHHHIFSAVNLQLFPTTKKPTFKEVEIDGEEEDEEIILPPRQSPDVMLKPSEFYEEFVYRNTEQCLEELEAPQKSQEWLEARKYCITASQFGAAIGESPYQTPEALVMEKVWFTFKGNAACEWGNDHEPHAKESFFQYLTTTKKDRTFKFREENLMKYADTPWMGVSPDGLVEYENGDIELVEYKCPAYLRNTKDHPYAKHPKNTPPHYYAQIQGIMGYLNMHGYKIKKCWFVVWQPHQTWITEHAFDKEYYDTKLFPGVKNWYFQKFLPALTHKHNGLLDFGQIHPSVELKFDN